MSTHALELATSTELEARYHPRLEGHVRFTVPLPGLTANVILVVVAQSWFRCDTQVFRWPD